MIYLHIFMNNHFISNYLNGYWLMSIYDDETKNIIDEHVLYISSRVFLIGGKIKLLYVYDEKINPVETNYIIYFIKSTSIIPFGLTQSYNIYLCCGDNEESPKSLVLTLNIIDGNIHLHKGDISYGHFIKDNSIL